MKFLGRMSSWLLMITGSLCIIIGVLSFFLSLFELVGNGLTLTIMGGVVFSLGVGINLVVRVLRILAKLADNLENIGSVARFLARKEDATKGGRGEDFGVAAYHDNAEHGDGVRGN